MKYLLLLSLSLLGACASEGWNKDSVNDSWTRIDQMEAQEKAQIWTITDPVKRQEKGLEWERFAAYRRQQLYFHNQEMINMDYARRGSNISGITNAFGQMGQAVVNRKAVPQSDIYLIEVNK